MTADEADGGRLTVNERLPLPFRQRQGSNSVELRRRILPWPMTAMDPGLPEVSR